MLIINFQLAGTSLLQAHLALETSPSFRLILHWTRLEIDTSGSVAYNETEHILKGIVRQFYEHGIG